jgi:hypothetical protein
LSARGGGRADAVRADAGGAVEGTAASSDGVPIRYWATGGGEPALVFVHAWTCDHHVWDAQVAHFAGQHRTVTPDLAGHGASGRGRRDWTVEAFGEDVRAVVEALDLRRVVLVGHSMGGPRRGRRGDSAPAVQPPGRNPDPAARRRCRLRAPVLVVRPGHAAQY